MFHLAKLSMLCGFTKGVSVNVLYLKINDVFEYNLPFVQSDFTCNPGLTSFYVLHVRCSANARGAIMTNLLEV